MNPQSRVKFGANSARTRPFNDLAHEAVARRFEITMPPDGATYLIDPTLRKEFQAIPLRAVGDTGRLEWTVDGRRLSQGSSQAIAWPLERGTHVVRARDARGRVAESAILVK